MSRRITSLANPRIKSAARLHKRRSRDRSGKMIIEGHRALARALQKSYPVEELFFCDNSDKVDVDQALIEDFRCRNIRVTPVSYQVLCRMAYRGRPEGILAVARQIHRTLSDLDDPEQGSFYLVVEAIEKPGNLGAMLRSVDASGADGLILCAANTDLYNPNVVRASTGTLFSAPVAEATTAEAIAWLEDHNVRSFAATPHADKLYTDVDFSSPAAIVIGSEQQGLTAAWLGAASSRIRIPMYGMADSLNAAISAALFLYEAVRQKGYVPAGDTPNVHRM